MRRLVQVDAFTTVPFTGNPAGVVPRADGLTTEQMQAVAREVNASETAFVLESDGPDHDVRVRYFTPVVEVPTCGHATVAAHFVRALDEGREGGRVMSKIGVGTLPVDIERPGPDEPLLIVMTQASPEIGPPLPGEVQEAVLRALGVCARDLDAECPIVIASTGHAKVIVGVRSRAVLDALDPDMAALDRLSRSGRAAPGFMVFTRAEPDPGVTTHGRMFAPFLGIPEDPVTGNGNGPLGAYLVSYGLLPEAALTDDGAYFLARQGEVMGRPGTAHVWVDVRAGHPSSVRVGGNAVVAFEAEIFI